MHTHVYAFISFSSSCKSLHNAKSYNDRGITQGVVGKYNKAIMEFNNAIKLKEDYAEAYFKRAMFKAKLGKYDEAKADFHKAQKINPDFARYIDPDFAKYLEE